MRINGLSRREFITLLGGSVAAWPLGARAQRAKMPTIGFLGANAAAAQTEWTAAYVQRLRELGWIERRTVSIEYRWAEGRNERYKEIAAEFVRINVDLIFTAGNEAALAAKNATSVIPIVFAVAAEPVRTGLVASLARPGGNVTGLSLQFTDLADKRLELLREIVPDLRRLAVMANVAATNAVLEMREVQAIARTLGLEVAPLEIKRDEHIVAAIAALKGRADALYVCGDPLMNTNRAQLNAAALAARMPTTHGFREQVLAGGLMSYGAHFPDLFRRAADYVDKILRGTKPSDLPVQQPTKFELVVNLKTAKVLGLTISPTTLSLADEVIE